MPHNVLSDGLLESYFGNHNHSDRSNFRLKDCINKVGTLIDYAVKIGLAGIAITDHETLAAHVEAIKYVQKNKKEGKIPQDFKLGLGDEIYLVDDEVVATAVLNNEPIKYYHFVLTAKDKFGYQGLKEISSLAWENSFWHRGMERVPTYKKDLERIMEKYKGHILAATACLGSEFDQTVLRYAKEPTQENKIAIHKLITWYKKLFGDDFYIEIQPSYNEEQVLFNKNALFIADAYKIKTIVATDAHYLNKEQAKIHEIYLKADEGEREVAEFYSSTYVMSSTEVYEYMKDYIPLEKMNEIFNNTLDLMSTIEDFDLAHEIIVPPIEVPEFELLHLFKDYYDKYEWVRRYSISPRKEDQYHLYQVEKGFIKYRQELNEENISRINEEYKELWLTSEKIGQAVSAYYTLTQVVIDLMWTVSFVGVSRGSAASYYTNYLLGIVQLNPIKYGLPHWRHLTHERPEMPDIDIDSEAAQRESIMRITKEKFGFENVLNISTLTKEKTKSAILTICRGMGIDNDIAQNIANLVPTDKTGMWTLRECLEGNPEEGKKPIKELVEEFAQYPGLLEAIETVEGLTSGRSVHASGVYIFRDGYLAQNAMMKTTGGQYVTQFNMGDSDYQGGLKLDFLTINALDRMRSCMELLLEYGKIEWQGSLRATYEKYLHPDVLEMEDPEMFKLLYEGQINDAFQFDSAVGSQAVQKIYPQNFYELEAGNSLMRLSPEGGESPLDKYVRHKKDITEWYREMDKAGLTGEEQELIKTYLAQNYGLCDTQEAMMLISMDPRISNFGLTEANKLRKGVAKKSQEVLEECWIMFEKGCLETGCSENLKQYVWNVLFKPQFGYSFSLPHIAGYTMILMQELNLATKYGVIFWKTACLSVNSGLFGEKEGSTNYGAVAKAVGDMKGVVLNPDINRSKLGFTPLEDEGHILFGLKPISGLGKDAVAAIMELRPFSSFDDFMDRAVLNGPITEKKAIILIKAGCFDKLYQDRRQLMIEFVNKVVVPKEKLTMTNLPHIIQHAPEELKTEVELYYFRNSIFGRNKKPMNKEIEAYFIKHFTDKVQYTFNEGKLVIDEKSFDKVYKKMIEPLRLWVISSEAADLFNKKKKREFWLDNCTGTIEQWEMETVVFYSDKHELDYVPLNNYFNISKFSEIRPDVITGYRKWGKANFPIFELSLIAGTVVDKNKDKHLVYISTQDGVVAVKYSKGSFLHYDKKIVRVNGKDKEVLDPSWFARGTRLVIVGRRRGDEFIPKVYKDTPYNHTTMKISSYNKNDVQIQLEKVHL
jgi:DNA polymerase-3 subunit alpha